MTKLNWVFLAGPTFATLTQTEFGRRRSVDETGVFMEDPVLDEGFMRRYRELLDAEDNAFDELEHAYEDGDREHFETDYAAWQSVLGRKLAFLERRGISVESPLLARPA